MKKYLSKILASSLVVAVFSATVLCCDFNMVQTAQASPAMKDMPDCPMNKGKANTPAKDSNCCKPELQADNPVKISFTFSQSVNNLSLVDSFIYQPSILKEKFNLSYLDGPPGPASDIPLYLITHNFRI